MVNKFGTAGDRIPVTSGSVWTVGPQHTFICGDLLDDENPLWELLPSHDVKFQMTDPPWNNQIGRLFRTMTGVDGPAGNEVNVQEVWDRMLTAQVTGYYAISIKEEAWLCERIKHAGGQVIGSWGGTYARSTRNLRYVAAEMEPGSLPLVEPLNYAVDCGVSPHFFDIVLSYLMNTGYITEDSTVLDTCVGLGDSVQAAARLGLGTLSNELGDRRLANAIEKVSKVVNHQPERII